MIGAYQNVAHFAYPGWRLSVPGGPAGGHYKGFTHNYSAGSGMDPQDDYEWERTSGASSHDAVHASPRNPRGIYRSSGEVPPRPNASGAAHTYRGYQTRRHAGTSVAPGSFPVDFIETDEDTAAMLGALPLSRFMMVGPSGQPYLNPIINPRIAGPIQTLPNPVAAPAPIVAYPMPAPAQSWHPLPITVKNPMLPIDSPPPPPPSDGGRPNTVNVSPWPGPAQSWRPMPPIGVPFHPIDIEPIGPINRGIFVAPPPPTSGPTSVVNQPPPSPLPAAPAPAVAAPGPPPISPAPAPTVATNVVVPHHDGSGNFINTSTGAVVPPSQVQQNPATGQLTAAPSAASGLLHTAENWLTQHSLISSVPNWVFAAGAAALLLASSSSSGRRR